MKTLIDYDYNMKKLKTHSYILVFHPFQSKKKSNYNCTFIILSHACSKVGHILSCTCISLKCI